MAINTLQMRDLVIVPTTKYLNLCSDKSTNLLLGTCAQESGMGEYLKQIKGPALSPFQIEPDTHNLVLNWLAKVENQEKYPGLVDKVHNLINPGQKITDQLITNLAYGCAIARVLYLSIAEPLPEADDVEGMAQYWKKYYNRGGKGKVQEFIDNWGRYVEPYI